MGNPNRLSEEDLMTIKRMTMEGYSQKDIGNKVGVTGSTIGYHQAKLGLKASNKWHFGETAEKEVPQLKSEKPKLPEPEVGTFVTVADKTLKLVGNRTGFQYECGVTKTGLTIMTGYGDPMEIDLKDLVNFGNELLDIADMINKMKADRFSL